MLYHRIPRLFAALALARGDGRYAKLLRSIGRVKLLILDDWGPETLTPEQARDLLEIIEDVTMRDRLFSPARRRSIAGMTSLAIRRLPMRSSIASSTMPTGSNLPARACASGACSNRPLDTGPATGRAAAVNGASASRPVAALDLSYS